MLCGSGVRQGVRSDGCDIQRVDERDSPLPGCADYFAVSNTIGERGTSDEVLHEPRRAEDGPFWNHRRDRVVDLAEARRTPIQGRGTQCNESPNTLLHSKFEEVRDDRQWVGRAYGCDDIDPGDVSEALARDCRHRPSRRIRRWVIPDAV